MIQSDGNEWEAMVPNRVAEAIKANHLFNYPYKVELDEKVDEEDLI